ncbi:MAG: SMP-30/gluconolactonase/LRE family protein [Spongiibacteraceae bacterium]
MLKKISAGLFVAIVAYFLLWPVAIDPVAWLAPLNPGYQGKFSVNNKLANLQQLAIAGLHGPEDVALDADGRIYAATHEGHILRLTADGDNAQVWASTGGRPLGIDFDGSGNLIVADAYRGLLSVSRDGVVSTLTDKVDGMVIRYADDVDVAADGKIYFSDASSKFGAEQWGGTFEASLIDLMEHGGYGRLLVYNPADGSTKTLMDNLHFANGVAVSHDQRSVLVNETGNYRVLRYWLRGPKAGQAEPFIEELPGFPDNISVGENGRYWLALVSPRNALLDRAASKPFVRKLVQRMPSFMRPSATAYGHIVALNDAGEVLENMQDPSGAYPQITSVTETTDYLYLGSLTATTLARLKKTSASD